MIKFKEYFPEKHWWKYSIFIACTAAILYALFFIIKNFDTITVVAFNALSSICSALMPLFIGLILTYLLSPLVDIINKKLMSKIIFTHTKDPAKLEKLEKNKRLISVLLTYILIIALIVVIIYAFAVLILGQFIFSGIDSMVNAVVAYVSTYEASIKSWVAGLPEMGLAEYVHQFANRAMLWLSSHFNATSAINWITGISGSIVNFAIGAIISIYILMDKDFFAHLWRKFLHLVLPQKANAVLTETLSDINGVLSAFIRGAMLDALIIAILSSVGLSILGLDFAVFIGCFAGISNVIPYFGPVLGMIPAFIVGTFTDGITQGITAVVVLLIVQQIDCNLIYPKIVGSTTGLHPLFVLLAVSVAGYYGGILGMILAVPLAGIVQTFILKWVHAEEVKQAAEMEKQAFPRNSKE
ncbi:AI-2E family transporter [Aminipila luticellarii]|uniref:AI-2E family transporter n=1 Tax=Aminipila luticellarii TaxID=2507160 RepID=A0A410PWL1_9FIRM|nr:AI-2E family transporter [Aminipila luticellarii]QAT43333.1 AI-2E family transporter [Aminipila luticellarii]